MKRIGFFAVAVAAVAGVVAFTAPVSGGADEEVARSSESNSPGYRDWKLISVATKKATSTICAPNWATM
jgi:hypothetical protein